MSPMLPALYGAATLLLNSTIWIFGSNGNSSVNGLISIDVSGSWDSSSPPFNNFGSKANTPGFLPPCTFSSLALAADGSSLWIYGGRPDATDGTLDEFAVFDTKAKNWVDTAPKKILPNAQDLPIVFAQSTVSDSKGVAYYYGGSSDPLNPDLTSFLAGPGLLRMDTSKNNYSTIAQALGNPGLLAWHTATLVNDTLMYVIGGVEPNSSNDFPVLVYNTAADKWSSQLNSTIFPPARHGHTAVLSDDKSRIIIFGGMSSSNTYLNDVWTLNLATNQWMNINTTGNAPSGMAFHSSVLVKNQMIVMFGYAQQKALNKIYLLDTTTWTWVTSFVSNTANTPSSGTGSQGNDTSNSDNGPNTIQKVPISIAGVAGIVVAAIAVAGIVMLSVSQPQNRVKPI